MMIKTVSHWTFYQLSRGNLGGFIGLNWTFLESSIEIFKGFQGDYMAIPREISEWFQVSQGFQEHFGFLECFRESQRSYIGDPGAVQGCFKAILGSFRRS